MGVGKLVAPGGANRFWGVLEAKLGVLGFLAGFEVWRMWACGGGVLPCLAVVEGGGLGGMINKAVVIRPPTGDSFLLGGGK